MPNCHFRFYLLSSVTICNRYLCTDIPDNFMSSLSVNGGLVHVVLCVRSGTNKGITVLIMNSPKLVIFHAFLEQNTSCEFESRLKGKFSQRFLGHYKVIQKDLYFTIDFKEYENSTDLLSLW